MNSCRCALRLPAVPYLYSTTQIKSSLAGGVLLAIFAVIAAPHLARAAVHASIIVDVQTGRVLFAQNAETPAHPASLTKMMTLFLTFGELANGRLKLNQHLEVSAHAAAQQPTKLWLRPGSTITVRSAILGITTRSANDAAVVLAEALGGSESQFAARMTRMAQTLGMTHTHFYNASGLPDSRQWTTAHDMAKLAIALIHEYPAYYKFFSARSFRFHGHIIYGHDHVLDEFDGADGLKTGYIHASGYNLVSSAVRDGRRLVGVVLGGNTARARDLRMMALLSRGFSTAPSRVIEAHNEIPAGVAPHSKSVVPSRVVETHSEAPGREAPHVKPAVEVVKTSIAAPAGDQFDSADCIIEIGGNFRSPRSVRRVLSSAIHTAPRLLSTRSELVVRLRGRHYRARFRGLEERAAIGACSALERHGYSCRIIRGPSPHRDLAGLASSQTAQTD